MSKKAMKKAKAKIDTEHDVINIFGQDVPMISASSGHYYLEIGDYKIQDDDCLPCQESITLISNFEGLEEKEIFKKVKHIHDSLGHPSRRVMEQMISNSSFKSVPCFILNKLYENCSWCLKFRKSKPTHKVRPPMSHDFNQVITMDLKIWPKKGKIILYIICMFSRYCVAKVIPNKRPESVIKVLVQDWFQIWGTPETIPIDNRTEFVNSKMTAICESYSIKMLNSEAHSPNQCGLVESNHKQVDHMVEIMMDQDENISFEEALKAAVFAKNMLINVYGFSPLQLVTGRQPRLPGATSNSLSGNEAEKPEMRGLSRINHIQLARKAFMEAENSERL